jgi:hypothetical protein
VREGWEDVGKVYIIASILDAVYRPSIGTRGTGDTIVAWLCITLQPASPALFRRFRLRSHAVGRPMRGAVELRTAFTDPG